MKKKLLITSLALAVFSSGVQALVLSPEPVNGTGITGIVTSFKRDTTGPTFSFDQDSGSSAPVGVNAVGTTYRTLMLFKLPKDKVEQSVVGVNRLSYDLATTGTSTRPAHEIRIVGMYDAVPTINADATDFARMTTDGTLVQTNFMTTSTARNTYHTGVGFNTNLFNAMRAAGFSGAADKYMLLSVYATDTSTLNSYSGFTKGSVRLDLQTVPEPSTYALIGGCLALGFVVLKRRRG